MKVCVLALVLLMMAPLTQAIDQAPAFSDPVLQSRY